MPDLSTPAGLREEALLVRAEAEATPHPEIKKRLLQLAGSYEVLARVMDALDT